MLPPGGTAVVAGKMLLFAVLLLMLALAPVCALAADVDAQSPTQYLWTNDRR